MILFVIMFVFTLTICYIISSITTIVLGHIKAGNCELILNSDLEVEDGREFDL